MKTRRVLKNGKRRGFFFTDVGKSLKRKAPENLEISKNRQGTRRQGWLRMEGLNTDYKNEIEQLLEMRKPCDVARLRNCHLLQQKRSYFASKNNCEKIKIGAALSLSHLPLFHARILLPLLCHRAYSLLVDTEGELVAFHQNYKTQTRLNQFRLLVRYIKIKCNQKSFML